MLSVQVCTLYLLELCQATQPKRKRRGRVGSFEPQHRQIKLNMLRSMEEKGEHSSGNLK